MLSFFKNLSLRAKIIGFNFLAISIIGAIAGILYHKASEENIEKFKIVFQSYVTSLQASVSAQFFERYGDVQAFAINPDVKSSNKQTIIEALNNYVVLYGIYDLIMVVDKNGNLVAANNKDIAGKDLNVQDLYKKNYSSEKWFSETLKGSFTADATKGYTGTYFEEPHFDSNTAQVYGGKRWGNSFSAQVKNEKNEVIGVISNRANFKWVEAEILNTAKGANEGLGVPLEMMVLNQDGSVLGIYNSEEHKGKYVRVDDELGTRNIYKSHAQFSNTKQSDIAVMDIFSSESNSEQVAAFTPITDVKWIKDIAWSTMIHIEKNEAYAHIYAAQKLFYIEFFIASIILTVFGFLFGNYISKQLSTHTATLTTETQSLLENSSAMATTSDQLSSAAIEQAAALQETVSAIDEVSAMVTKNAENARRSKEISQSSEKSALEGKKTMEEMLDVIDQIQKSNTEMMDQVKKSNEEFTNIVNVIGEIGSKTKVINDIVFQTKLLSFNASVEAARAGAHGKGFAVVAEEVGNLAQMSGNASKEISVLLENSIVKVQNIVNETRTRVDKLVDISKQKVDVGIETAKLCSGVLEEIVTSVSQVNQMVEEISTASTEQAQGVSEITKAMNQLDQVTQQNTQAASVSSDTALSIKGKSEAFQDIVGSINRIIWGSNGKPVEHEKSEINRAPNKILSFKKIKGDKAVSKKTTEFKKVAGDSMMPDKDDPRFEDV